MDKGAKTRCPPTCRTGCSLRSGAGKESDALMRRGAGPAMLSVLASARRRIFARTWKGLSFSSLTSSSERFLKLGEGATSGA